MTKEYVIFNQRLAGYLMYKGFVLKRMSKADNNSSKNVFLFNESEELFKRIKEYKDKMN